MTTQQRKKGQPYRREFNALPDFSAVFEIEQKYRMGAEVLICAVLREPHNFARYANRLHPAWWQESKFADVAAAIFAQFYGPARSYSVRSICAACDIPRRQDDDKTGEALSEAGLLYLMQQHADTDLALALEVFEPTYRQWIEGRCAHIATSGIAQGWEAERIRNEQDAFRRDRYAYNANANDGEGRFKKWFEAKVKGLEINYPCKPSIGAMIRKRFKTAYEPGEYVLIAGRPSMGKTHLLLNEIWHFARSGARGIFISADMERLKVQKRLLGQVSGNNPRKDWTAFSEHEHERLALLQDEIEKMPVKIIDDVTNIYEIAAICHAEHYREPLQFLAIDYVQQLTTGRNDPNRNNELTEVSRIIKLIGKQLRIPVLVLSQLSRAVEQRGGSKRPQLSDLRDSGSLEQDATTVIFVYRPEYYGIEEFEDGASTKGFGELIFAKQQEDETGSLAVKFDGVTGWYDPDTEQNFPNESDDPLRSTFTIEPNRQGEADGDIPF